MNSLQHFIFLSDIKCHLPFVNCICILYQYISRTGNFILAHKPLFDKIGFLSRHTLILFKLLDLWVHRIRGYDFNLSKNFNVAVHKSYFKRSYQSIEKPRDVNFTCFTYYDRLSFAAEKFFSLNGQYFTVYYCHHFLLPWEK